MEDTTQAAPAATEPKTEKKRRGRDGRRTERGEGAANMREAVQELMERSGRQVESGAFREGWVEWAMKRTRDGVQVIGFEPDDPRTRVYALQTLRYTPKAGERHYDVLVTLDFTVERKGRKATEPRTFAMPVVTGPLYRTGQWTDKAITRMKLKGWKESNRPGAAFVCKGPNGKMAVIRDKSMIPAEGEATYLVAEGLSAFEVIAETVDGPEPTDEAGTQADDGALATIGDVMGERLTSVDPWQFIYAGHMYDVAAVLGGLKRNATLEQLQQRFAELSQTESVEAQVTAFKTRYGGMEPSVKARNEFSAEWGLIVGCYQQAKAVFRRRDCIAQYYAKGAGVLKAVGKQVAIRAACQQIGCNEEAFRQALNKVGWADPGPTIKTVGREAALTVAGYFLEQAEQAAAAAAAGK